MSAEGMVNLVRRAEDRYLNRGYGRLDLPFAVVTGYLGSGKTTLLHNILHKRSVGPPPFFFFFFFFCVLARLYLCCCDRDPPQFPIPADV